MVFFSIGMLLVILNGGIDLSVGSILALCRAVAGALMFGVEVDSFGIILYLPVGAVVLMNLCVGDVNGVLIAIFKVLPFVATLGAMDVTRRYIHDKRADL